ncbi:MAG: ATP-binding cassette domain-containing protein [Cellulosilyticaceae bacterium]
MSILEIKDLYYKVENTNILNGISISIDQGDCISLVGQSGSGKSTLMKLCADLIPLSKGGIWYKGKSYKEYDPIELRRQITYCIQMPHLFGESIYENLEFPFKIRKESMDKEKVVELLEKFNLDESFLTKEVKSLSGGEKQRIALIRNLIYTPDILLLDEATSALDKENTQVIEQYVKELNQKGVTVLWITHDAEQSEGIFNKRIVISEGMVECMEEIK